MTRIQSLKLALAAALVLAAGAARAQCPAAESCPGCCCAASRDVAAPASCCPACCSQTAAAAPKCSCGTGCCADGKCCCTKKKAAAGKCCCAKGEGCGGKCCCAKSGSCATGCCCGKAEKTGCCCQANTSGCSCCAVKPCACAAKCCCDKECACGANCSCGKKRGPAKVQKVKIKAPAAPMFLMVPSPSPMGWPAPVQAPYVTPLMPTADIYNPYPQMTTYGIPAMPPPACCPPPAPTQAPVMPPTVTGTVSVPVPVAVANPYALTNSCPAPAPVVNCSHAARAWAPTTGQVYVLEAKLVDACAGKPGHVVACPKMVVAEGKQAVVQAGNSVALNEGSVHDLVSQTAGPNTGRHVFLGSLIKARVEGMDDNQVKIDLVVKHNDVEAAGARDILVLGQHLRTVRTVTLGKSVRVVLDKNDHGAARSYVEFTVTRLEDRPTPVSCLSK